MYIEDHSITYLNLQDKSGMTIKTITLNNIKFDTVTKIVNYRSEIFEYLKKTNTIFYVVNNINPNETYLSVSGYFESNVIEDYRNTLIIIVKENKYFLFNLYNNDNTINLLHAGFTFNKTDNKKLDLIFTTTDIHTNITLETDMFF